MSPKHPLLRGKGRRKKYNISSKKSFEGIIIKKKNGREEMISFQNKGWEGVKNK